MAPKILLADDSMTAQNMGKKILAEGGYDVIAVSNGAAALKKIAEVHPELVILDVYMPGYSGLEVCERLRGALETAHLPVVLTVGKLEPFKPEEGIRVKADGLLVKPFEATDLLAAVKKLLEKGAAPAEPVVHVDTVKLEPPLATGVSDVSQETWKPETPDYEKTQKIEVPQEMAAAPAMSELLEAPPAPAAAEPPQTMAAAAGTGVAAFNIEPAAPEFDAAAVPVFDPDLGLDEPAEQLEPTTPTQAEPESTAPASADAILDALAPELELNVPTPAPEAVAPMPDVEFTAAPRAQDVATEPLPDLEPTVLQDSIPVEVASDAALVTSPGELAQFTTKFGVENPEDTPVGLVADLPAEQAASLTKPQAEPVAEASTFEQSAASILEELMEAAPGPAPVVGEVPAAEPEVLPEVLEPVVEGAPGEVPMGGLELSEEPRVLKPKAPTEPAPAFKKVAAPTQALPKPESVRPEPTVQSAPVIEPPARVKEAQAEPSVAEQAFSLEEELRRTFSDVPAAPQAPEDDSVSKIAHVSDADTGAGAVNDEAIAQLVERLLERLKPEVVAAIIKELKS